MDAGEQKGQEFYYIGNRPIGWIHNGWVTFFPKKWTDYKGYLKDEITRKELELQELKNELKSLK